MFDSLRQDQLAPSTDDANALPGTIASVEYWGAWVQIRLQIGAAEMFTRRYRRPVLTSTPSPWAIV